jgi:hypothetical protein
MPDNITRLREAGFTIKTPMPEEYERVLQDLGDAEMDALTQMDALVSLIRRLDEVRVARDAEKDEHANWILPP